MRAKAVVGEEELSGRRAPADVESLQDGEGRRLNVLVLGVFIAGFLL